MHGVLVAAVSLQKIAAFEFGLYISGAVEVFLTESFVKVATTVS